LGKKGDKITRENTVLCSKKIRPPHFSGADLNGSKPDGESSGGGKKRNKGVHVLANPHCPLGSA